MSGVTSVALNVVLFPVGVDDMEAGLCGIPRMSLHSILHLDPYLVLRAPHRADIGWTAILTGLTGGLTLPTIILIPLTTQVDFLPDEGLNYIWFSLRVRVYKQSS